MIKLQIIGNLGKDCIAKEINGKHVINFSVAHTERFKDAQGNQKERTTWVECAYWTDRTAIAQYLKKGQMVYAEGAPEAEGYTNKEGQVASTLRMRVQNVQLLGGGVKEGQGANQGNVTYTGNTPAPTAYSQPSQPSQPAVSAGPVDDDLPF